jgi:septum formation protein
MGHRAGKLVLASSSPRRRELLSGMGFSLDIVRPEADESARAGESPAELACRLARDKAAEVAFGHFEGRDEIVIGADTIVVLGGEVLGKPKDAPDAVRMLGKLSGATHEVITAFCVINPGAGKEVTRHVHTMVTFRRLSPEMIARYVGAGEPMDKAGAYAAQGVGASLIERIEGSYTNVVGLPLCELAVELASFGCEIP